MVIEVTADDIENGIPLNAEQCAIACALSRYGFIKPEVQSGRRTITFRDERGKTHKRTMPASAVAFANRFDDENNNDVKPFSFRIRKLGK